MECVLVTGGCGFIASNFINQLDAYKIINVDVMSYCSNIYNITNPNCTTIIGDIKDRKCMDEIFKTYTFSTIFHFAAQSHVDNSFEDPIGFTMNNAVGTHVLIDSTRAHQPNVQFIHFSTDEVYGENTTGVGFTEDAILNPTNPYSASKAAAEMIVQSYIKSFGMNVKIIRCNNVYGPNQYPEKLIPKFIHILKQNKKCTIHGSGSVQRSFIHVHDVCSAVHAIWKRGSLGEIYNISSDYEYSVLDITRLIIKTTMCTDEYDQYIDHIHDRPFNDKSYLNNCTKLKNLGWRQEYSEFQLVDYIKRLYDTVVA
jgi:nucleoside-diphosphate-sugar epimerase